jgi:hypothetical protein
MPSRLEPTLDSLELSSGCITRGCPCADGYCAPRPGVFVNTPAGQRLLTSRAAALTTVLHAIPALEWRLVGAYDHERSIVAHGMAWTRLRACAGLLARWWPPLVAWLTATTVVALTCIHDGWPPFSALKTWARADSGLYLDVAEHGYSLLACPPGGLPGWCGNAGWLPAYAWVSGALAGLGAPTASAALAVSWMAGLATILLVWWALPPHVPRVATGIALAYAAFAPGMVYRYAVFPLSLLTVATVAFLALMQRDRWFAAGIAAAVGVLAYPIGLLAAPAGAVWLLAQRSVRLPERARRVAVVAYPSLAALWVFVFDQWLETGRWNAYLLVQRKYDHHLQDPFGASVRAVHRVFGDGPLFTLTKSLALQTLLVAFVLVCVLIELGLRRGAHARPDALVAIWAVMAWAVPVSETYVATYRGEAALLPLALLVRRLPRPLGIAITVAAAVLAVSMTKLYLRNYLI